MKRPLLLLLVLVALLTLLLTPAAAQDPSVAPGSPASSAETAAPATPAAPVAIAASDGPLVQAVFFFSPTCGHCEYVITQVLPDLFYDNGGEYAVTYDETVLPDAPAYFLMSNGHLQLLMVDVSTETGSEAFLDDSDRLGIDSPGVPRIDIGETEYLVGSTDIPAQFPDIVQEGLAGDGLGWPPTPGLAEAIAPFIEEGSVPDPAAEAESSAAPADDQDETDDALAVLPLGGDESWTDRFGKDVAGNSVSVVVLGLLLLSGIAAPILAFRGALPDVPGWLVIVLAAIGFAVAAYLANVETTGSSAVCGPVGNCNAVQESEYAKLLGIPIGVLGMLGYGAIAALWVVSRVARGTLADAALLLIGVGAWVGTLFSIYLTFLEPFVIGATCMWCITSAVVMLLLLWVSAGPAVDAWDRLRGDRGSPATVNV
jgi:uncharacterized membrane protein